MRHFRNTENKNAAILTNHRIQIKQNFYEIHKYNDIFTYIVWFCHVNMEMIYNIGNLSTACYI